MDEEKVAVRVRGACKSYGDNDVLKGLDMTVQQSTIYGLLGPSGCGKTTLLNCIVGRSRLDAGEIDVQIRSKSQMGYMPQDLALFTEFTVDETLHYFGQAYNMKNEEIKKRITELLSLLELPNRSRQLDTLSGGQQRRVSLCVAFLHNPSLLILDEPTVGVDPLLSHSIWKQLVYIANVQKKTIIITTHYIQEATQAHTIGLLRNGTLLEEGEPNQLLQSYQTDNLEKVFLILSQRQENVELYDNKKSLANFEVKSNKNQIMPEGRNLHWCRIKAQLMKSKFWMGHNIRIMLFLMILPIVQSALFCLTVGLDPKGLYIGVVNGELSPGSYCPPMPKTCIKELTSCRYIQLLKEKDINLIYYESTEDAYDGVASNEVWGYIKVPSNYSKNLLRRISLNLNTPDDVLTWSEIHIWMDMSNQYISNLLRRDLVFTQIDFLKDLYSDCGWPPAAAGVPINFGNAVFGSNRPSFAHFAVPAVIQLFEFYLPMMFTVGAILMEKRDGILERSLVAGITIIETLIAHIIVQAVVLAIQTILMLIVLFIIFDNPMEGSLLVCVTLLALIGITGMCYGFFVSTLCDLDSAALYMGLGSFFPLAMLSGMVWPFEGMHWSLRSIGWLLPLTQTTESFRAITARAWDITHPTVYKGFISSFGWILFFILATFIVIRAQNGIRGNIKIPILSRILRTKF